MIKNTATHTPGPWIFKNGSVFEKSLSTDGMGERKMIVGAPTGYNSTKFTTQEIDANARLIAAAPDLLAALEGLMVDAPREGTKYPMPARWAAAYSAIAKAEGREVAR